MQSALRKEVIIMTGPQLLNVQELKKLTPNVAFKSIFVVTSLFQKNDKNGKPYYEISVSDSTGVIDAKIWSDAAWFDRSDSDMEIGAPAKRLPDDDIKKLTGCTLGVDGKTAEYRGQLQFNFNKLTLLNQDKFPAAQYLPRSPLSIDSMIARYEELISSCRPEISSFLKFVFSGNMWKDFRDWPAAVSHHHAYANGLIEHTLSVADCAKSMAESMVRSGYAVDVDVVIAGALLHDIVKLDSYKMQSVPEMTLEGAVIDHVAQGYLKFMGLAEKAALDDKLKLHLAHILLSHHGQREYGSPVVPATPEAMIVSSADELDFRMFCWHDSVKDLAEDQPISQWHNGTGRRFWNR